MRKSISDCVLPVDFLHLHPPQGIDGRLRFIPAFYGMNLFIITKVKDQRRESSTFEVNDGLGEARTNKSLPGGSEYPLVIYSGNISPTYFLQ